MQPFLEKIGDEDGRTVEVVDLVSPVGVMNAGVQARVVDDLSRGFSVICVRSR